MTLRDAFAALTSNLEAVKAQYALIGGLAVSTRVEPRTTRDVDVVVDVSDDEQAEQLVYQLIQRGYRPATSIEQTAKNRLATIRLEPPEGGILLDLLFASSGIESEIVEAAERLLVLPGIETKVATTGHLIALKLLSVSESRPQDQVDLVGLMGVATAADLADAKAAIRLIAVRGYARGRDLEAALEKLSSGAVR